MNAHTALRAYETVDYRAWSYRPTEDDFPQGALVKTDALTGKRFATGRNVNGLMITLQLDVPLCKGCDKEIVHHLCPDCELAFAGEAE